jgi:hypothetical protein
LKFKIFLYSHLELKKLCLDMHNILCFCYFPILLCLNLRVSYLFRKSIDATDVCSENDDIPTSPSSMGSSKTVVYDSGVEANYSPEGLQKTVWNFTDSKKQRPTSAPERKSSGNVRPNSPPPLPPHSPGSSGKF